jgi:cytochrome c
MRKVPVYLPAMALVAVAAMLTAVTVSAQNEGEKTFKKYCSACHSTEAGKNRVGPSVFGVVGRPAATAQGFNYSQQMKSSGLTWDEATLTDFLTSPKEKVPGCKMTFAGVKGSSDVTALVDCLKTLK